VTSDNFLLGDLSPEVWGVENHALFSQLRLPESRSLVRRTGIAVTPEAAGNYYHWLIDLLPRVAFLKTIDGDYHNFDRILINGCGAAYEMESLQALGLPAAKVIYVSAADRFRVEHAIIPSMDHGAKVIAPWKIEALRNLRDSLRATAKNGPLRLYISRKEAAGCRVLNEAELEKELQKNGFTSLAAESHPWAEQVALFAEAEAVLAPHDGALANIAFCKPGALVAEINTRARYRDWFLQLAASAGLRYRFIEAASRVAADRGSRRATENEAMVVDSHALRNLMRAL
jgi:capsular polysaccharide biosynthesis protein